MKPTILLHGGAGSMKKMGDERAGRYREALRDAAACGSARLESGASALDVVEAIVLQMEDSGAFNAGLGSCLTMEGGIEMDAAIMDGADGLFGGVAGVPGVANPVRLARLVAETTPHCLLASEGAASLARKHALAFRSDFPSQERIDQWRRKKERLGASASVDLSSHLAAMGGVLGAGDESTEGDVASPLGERGADALSSGDGPADVDLGHDTVGAVALDASGRVAAAVSTGGLWLKLPGRIGDSPLPGAGLWADNALGAAVATGTGESILRVLLSKHVVDGLEAGPAEASRAGIELVEQRFGTGQAGVIAIHRDGRVGFSFHTRGMGRAVWRVGMGEPATAIWPGEAWDRPVTEHKP